VVGSASMNRQMISDAAAATNFEILTRSGVSMTSWERRATTAIETFDAVRYKAGAALQTAQSAGNALLLQAYDVNGAAYTTFATLTANNEPSLDLADSVTKASSYIYRAGGTDVPVGDGGHGASTARGGAANLGVWHILAASAVAVPHTGNTNETALATIAIPAGAIGANGVVRITTSWIVTTSGNNKIMRVRMNGISGTILQTTTQTTNISTQLLTHIKNRNSQSSQTTGFTQTSTAPYGASTAAVATAAIDTSAAVDLVLSGQLADGGDTVTLDSYMVELFYQA
jgi:hypothetical protein